MYAIVRSGGKQYRVEEKSIVTVDKLEGEAGESITLGEVLCIGGIDTPQWGKPTVAGAAVTATIVEQAKGKKIDAFIYKAKKNIRKHWGHRQQLTRVRIESIATGA
jgi:large subunit ribosomal protein L21